LGTRAQLQIFFGGRRNHDREFALLSLGSGGKQIDRAFGRGADFADFHDQAVRIGSEADGEVGVGLGFEHDAGHARHGLRHANAADEGVADIDRFIGEIGGELGVVKIEVNAIGPGQAMRFILHLVFEVEHHRAGIRRRPVADAGDAGEFRKLLRRRGRGFGFVLIGSLIGACGRGS